MHREVGRVGRPRSEQARIAVMHAVDDLLVEMGYAAMTMKGIAERAGVGRQTVYRWWSTKAQILSEAVSYDAPPELSVTPTGSPERDLTAYVNALRHFLTASETGTAYRALLGEAQHDPAVAALVTATDPVVASARTALVGALPRISDDNLNSAIAFLAGPVVFSVLNGHPIEASSQLAIAVLNTFGG